ncbi:transcription antitermination factor NusB [Sneathiella sp. CAU 1612]|jgi:transcription antitermination protein NusB|uniref:Transcription antitermination protein NusB n=1 Tax=Sneathiella sedimenti TaxID=2816034 RepID=A0ABS3F7B7_9PROT|nr:transcription antitermination factor NusB [Sneathiella sedimenti]MBO0334425.1 transcription antitermination factor NusB [Sneathiella sedimenti]
MNARNEKRGDKHSRRTLARLNAVQALYQMEHDNKPPQEVVEEFLLHRVGKELDGDQFKDSDKPLFEDIVLNTKARQEEIDKLIGDRLEKDRTTERLEVVLLCLLRAATYEFLARVDMPAKVLIKEYIGLARTFFTGKEPALVNGVLDKIAKELRTGEFD